MVDLAQIVIFLVIIVLTALLVSLGIQVFFILRELRRAVGKANKILDDTHVISESVLAPISTLSSVIMGVKAGASLVNLLKKLFALDKKEVEIVASEDRVRNMSDLAKKQNGELKSNASLSEQERKPLMRRFFRGISKKKSIGTS